MTKYMYMSEEQVNLGGVRSVTAEGDVLVDHQDALVKTSLTLWRTSSCLVSGAKFKEKKELEDNLFVVHTK